MSNKETPLAITVATASLDLRNDLDSIAHPHLNGVVTENQKFLHVYVDDLTGTDNNLSVQIYGYTYASGKWAALLEHDGDGTRSVMEPSCGSSGVAQHFIYKIEGIDRIAFAKSSTAIPDYVFAACTTF